MFHNRRLQFLRLAALALSAVLAVPPLPYLTAQAGTAATKNPMPKLQKQQPKIGLPPPSPEPQTGGQSPGSATSGNPPGSGGGDGKENYPVVGQLETITFGFSKAGMAITQRLNELEQAIFHQTYPHLSLADRSQKLQDTLLGPSVDPDVRAPNPYKVPRFNPEPEPQAPQYSMPTQSGMQQSTIDPGLLELWRQPFFQTSISREEGEKFALEVVNRDRQQSGFAPLQWDDTSYRVAKEQVDDLCNRNTVSHLNKAGENPDLRYTKAGGNDALSESLATVSGAPAQRLNRALVDRMIEEMKGHQDDRDSLMSSDATHFGFSIGLTKDKEKAIACAEVLTKHAIVNPIPAAAKPGDKVEVKGVLLEPYRFQKVTMAWEGALPDSSASSSDPEVPQDEAMPYFPPLDYVAYANKAEHDREKLANILKTTAIIAAIAGGVFMPPVALAAPLIAMAPAGSGEPKAAADVPVRGGVKVTGATFSGNLPLSHQGKEGLYYVTVWATTTELGRPIPVSRRAIVVRAATAEPVQELKGGAPEPEKTGNAEKAETAEKTEKAAAEGEKTEKTEANGESKKKSKKLSRKEARKQAAEEKKQNGDDAQAGL